MTHSTSPGSLLTADSAAAAADAIAANALAPRCDQKRLSRIAAAVRGLRLRRPSARS